MTGCVIDKPGIPFGMILVTSFLLVFCWLQVRYSKEQNEQWMRMVGPLMVWGIIKGLIEFENVANSVLNPTLAAATLAYSFGAYSSINPDGDSIFTHYNLLGLWWIYIITPLIGGFMAAPICILYERIVEHHQNGG
jgi:glycerol uptake facilitator-like aquaporin